MKFYSSLLFRVLVVIMIALLLILDGSALAGQAASGDLRPAAASPNVVTQVFNVNCVSRAAVNTTYAKLADLGSFNVDYADSEVQLTYNGRIFVSSFSASTGAVFELRVDDAASPVGRARATLRSEEAGAGGEQVSIMGIFENLAPGTHTASMWVRTFYGTGTQAMVDPGCWQSDVLIVQEVTPFGAAFLPAVQK